MHFSGIRSFFVIEHLIVAGIRTSSVQPDEQAEAQPEHAPVSSHAKRVQKTRKCYVSRTSTLNVGVRSRYEKNVSSSYLERLCCLLEEQKSVAPGGKLSLEKEKP
jgi:hypothetical protein